MAEGIPPTLSVVTGDGGGIVWVLGVLGDNLGALEPAARKALAQARYVAGGRRQLAAWRTWLADRAALEAGARAVPTIEMTDDADDFVQQVAQRAVDGGVDVCVLASGDPGFFGLTRALLRVVDRHRLRVLPAPSSVAVAFSRLGLPWDDAVVASAHGRPLADAVRSVRLARKAAVLTSPENPPQALGRALLDAGVNLDLVAVCSRLGCADETVHEIDLLALAAGRFDPLSVVVLVGPGGLQSLGWGVGSSVSSDVETGPSGRALAWGLPESAFTHRGGMVTKSEIRSVILGKLALPAVGVLWDLGAGSGSVAVECALVCPGLTVFAVEQDEQAAAVVAANAARFGAGVHVVTGHAPEALGALPDPDRVFVGGGGSTVLDAAVRRLRPGGRVVATFAALGRAAEAVEQLGRLVQVSVARASQLPDGGWRLTGANPVFVVWGPVDDEEPPGVGRDVEIDGRRP
ncbi:MAG: precorrin-6y C5,15-methyltransferase (decarboxylating) subunit CbiE [Actinomycetota bacterium]|nr:precorrin-6y C5,15-methyltransferase (decarboxylating) subunit CbiE [Actinomycetota bacterium]